MGGVEQQPGPEGVKNAQPQRSQGEGGAGVVADREQSRRLFRLQLAGAPQLCQRRGSQGIAAENPQGEGSRHGPLTAPEPRQNRPQQPPQQLGQPQGMQHPAQHKKGKQGGNDHLGAKPQPPPRSLRDGLGKQQNPQQYRQNPRHRQEPGRFET